MNKIGILFLMCLLVEVVVGPPVDPKKEKKAEKKDSKEDKPEELDEFGLEYGRYLQQVVQTLEEDKEFAKKLENVSAEQIKSGHIAKELEFVKHNVRSKLDELKRIEVERLRKLIQQQMERVELGLYRDEDGHLLNSPDGRRWRTIQSHNRGLEGGVGDRNFWLGLDRKGVKIPKHLDIDNPQSFEIEDLKKLIQSATRDLEEIDRERRKEFKKYELEKEAKYRESLKNMTEEEKKDAEKHHEELLQKHKDHPKVHHPGSKPQLEEVWEEQDHLPKEEFNPKTFFAMHDLNGDGHLDVQEVEALLIPEVRKLYNPNNEEDDPAEMEEEFHRMREHIFNETDKNKDKLISLEEFLKMTEDQEFQQDEGWRSIDEQQIYSEAELEEYMRQRQMEMQGYQQHPYADQRQYYDVGNSGQGLPPHINYQVPPGGIPPQQNLGRHSQQYGSNLQMQYPGGQPIQGVPPQQYQGGHPQQQQFQGVPPQQYQAGHPQQQQFQGVPPQQYQAGHPQQQQFQGVPPQQYQAGYPQQHLQGVPPQQYQGGHPPQYQAVPQQQYQAGQLQQQKPQGQVQDGKPQKQNQAGVNNQQQPPQQANQFAAGAATPVPDASNSINQIPNAGSKPNVPQQPAQHPPQQAPEVKL